MINVTPNDWDNFSKEHLNCHLLQTGSWGQFKSLFGWTADYVIVGNCGAQILFKPLPLGLKIAYIPKGPVGEKWNDLWPEVHKICHQNGAFALKIEPDFWEPLPEKFHQQLVGFRPSLAIQPRRTVIVDLLGDERLLLDRMKQKTRYNIRLGRKKNIMIKKSHDIDAFYKIILKTGERDRFGIHNKEYYQKVYQEFHSINACELFIAYFEGVPLAGLMIFSWGSRAWYFYGASNDQQRDRMPTYLLQWEAILWAKEHGCSEYDLWGIPDENEDILEKNFLSRSDGLWGVYRFKRGFGGNIKRTAGAWDYVYSPAKYKIYQLANKVRKTQMG